MALNRKQRRQQEKQAKAMGLPGSDETAKILEQAILLLRNDNDWEKAEPLFRGVLKTDPKNPQANYYIGMHELENMNNPNGAANYFMKAYPHMKGRHDFHNNLGTAYSGSGQQNNALTEFEKAHKIIPDDVSIITNLITTYFSAGNIEKSLEFSNLLLSIDPKNEVAKNSIACHAAMAGDHDEAEGAFRKLIEESPDNLEYRYKLSTVLRDKGNYAEALDVLSKIMAEDPSYAEAFLGFGDVLIKQKKYVDAAPYFRAAIEINPKFGQAYGQIGYVNQQYFEFEEAAVNYSKAIELIHNDINLVTPLRINFGICLMNIGKIKEAEDNLREAIKSKPNRGDAHWNFALLNQTTGNLKKGWEEAEWRYDNPDFPSPVRHFPQPQWDGSDLKGKSIILWSEQGIGDQIRFASMVPEIIKTGADVHLECTPKIVKLLSQCFPEIKVHPYPYIEAEKGEIDFDFQCSTYSLAKYLRPTLKSFPKNNFYIKSNPERKEHWKKYLNNMSDRPKVGIFWRSGLVNIARSIYMPLLDEFEPILKVDGVDFISLMYDKCPDEIADLKEKFNVDIHETDIDMRDDVDEAASFISNLDLVVTTMSSVFDLAGGQGIPAFMVMPVEKHFLKLGDDNVPWHSTVRVFSKHLLSDPWNKPMNETANATREFLKL